MTKKIENEGINEGTIAQDSLHPASHPVTDDSKSKFEYIAHMIGAMHAMRKEDLVKWFNDQQAIYGPNKDHGEGDHFAKNQD